MSSLGWYWHRLKAMRPAELAAHGRRKLHQITDNAAGARRFAKIRDITQGSSFPVLPSPKAAPNSFKTALEQDVAEIMQGQWIAFGYLKLQVDQPPRWHKDYLAGVDMVTSKPALKLHHRLEGKADIKLMWEPNRWYSLVRLAQGAYVLGHAPAARRCLDLLRNWVEKNPAYLGWNWTSGLETGLRLIQFAWIDALLSAAEFPTEPETRALVSEALPRLRAGILPPHLWFTWRDRSFGSSANNHLFGELAGLIIALVRWPALVRWAAPLERLQALWEREVLTQFASDGGNREQALNYHLFSWEFCWQTRLALKEAGRTITPGVEDRLREAVSYFTNIQVPEQQWDYGDSDSAFVTPFFADWPRATNEWHQWMRSGGNGSAIGYWMGPPPVPRTRGRAVKAAGGWQYFEESGYAVCRQGAWVLRWDLSPLGYLATAGHGHCDALHLSIWYRNQPIVIDPGTGAYHADRRLRDYLASWEAHNGPHPVNPTFPQRRGAFLWSVSHARPTIKSEEEKLAGELTLPNGTMLRRIALLDGGRGWKVEDAFLPSNSGIRVETEVFWQLAPNAAVEQSNSRSFRLRVGSVALTIECSDAWQSIEVGTETKSAPSTAPESSLHGLCSSAFRRVERGPCLLLRGRAEGEKRLVTQFRAES